jgi:hypothetical protein
MEFRPTLDQRAPKMGLSIERSAENIKKWARNHREPAPAVPNGDSSWATIRNISSIHWIDIGSGRRVLVGTNKMYLRVAQVRMDLWFYSKLNEAQTPQIVGDRMGFTIDVANVTLEDGSLWDGTIQHVYSVTQYWLSQY